MNVDQESPQESSSNPFAADAGTWVAMGLGFHTGDGSLTERAGLALGIEFRTKSFLSVLLEYQRWWAIEERYPFRRVDFSGMLSGGLKGRVAISAFTVSGEAGLWFPGAFGATNFYYGGGIELPLSGVVRSSVEVLQNSNSLDHPVYFLFGISVRNY